MLKVYLIKLTRHHNVEHTPHLFFDEASDEDPRAQILAAAIREHYGGQFEVPPTVAEISKEVERVTSVEDKDDSNYGQLVCWEDEEKTEKVFITFWIHSESNFGFGLGETSKDTARHENVWIDYQEWKQPERLTKFLMTWSKEDLVLKLCRQLALEMRCCPFSELEASLNKMAGEAFVEEEPDGK